MCKIPEGTRDLLKEAVEFDAIHGHTPRRHELNQCLYATSLTKRVLCLL